MSFDFKDRINQNIAKEQAQKQVKTVSAESEKTSDYNIFSKAGKILISPFSTVVDFGEDVVSGVSKSLEGIVDYGMGLIGSAASMFGSDSLEKALSEAAKYDFTRNNVSKIDDWAEDSSWLSGDNKISNTIHQVGQGIGGMLPAIAVTYFTGGLGAGAAASSLAGTATFAAGAAGQSTEEALNEGANIKQATAYGTLSGATEGVIEYLSGKLGGTNILTKGAGKSIVSGGLKNIAKSYVEEGTEEVVSDIINPLWKSITYSGKYETPEISDLIQSFNVGGLTALAMGGASKATSMAKYGVDGSRAESIYNDIIELNQEEYNLEKDGKLNSEKRTQYENKRSELVSELNTALEKMNTESKKYKNLNKAIDVETAVNFDARKTLVDETVKSYNERTGSDLKVEYVDNAEINGSFDSKTNTISIDKNAENPYSIVLGHEITHSTESNSKYSQVYDEVINTIGETNLAQEREKLGKYEQYKDLSVEELNKEVVANYISENFFTNFKQAQKLISNNKTLGGKIISFIKDKIARIGKNNAEYKQLKSIENVLQEIMDNKEISVANIGELAVQYSGKKNVKISKEEYAILKEQIMKQNTIGKRSNRAVDYAFTANYFYIYNNSGLDSFQVTKKIKINKNENRINALRRVIDGSNGNRKISDSEIKEFISRKRSDIRNSSSSRNGRTTTGNVGVSGEPRGNFSRGDIEQGGSDNGPGVKYSAKQKRIDKDIEEYNKRQNYTEEDIDKLKEESLKKTQVVMPKTNRTFKETLSNTKNSAIDAFKGAGNIKTKLEIEFTDSSAGVINKIKKKFADNKEKRNELVKKIGIAIDSAQRATARADYKIGEVVSNVWSPIEANGEQYTQEFENYLLHNLNIIRMQYSSNELKQINSLNKELNSKLEKLEKDYQNGKFNKKSEYELQVSKTKSIYDSKIKAHQEELKNCQDAPVFGKDHTKEASEKIVKQYEKEHPEFIDYAEKVYDVFDELKKKRLENGLISQIQYDLMTEVYGRRYVPTTRVNKDGVSTSALSGNIGVKNGLYRATGGTSTIQSIMVSMCDQMMAVEKQSSMNNLFNEIQEIIPEEFANERIISQEKVSRDDIDGNIIPKDNEVFYYKDGERVIYQVDSHIASLFKSLRNQPSNFENGVLGKGLQKTMKWTRNVTTQYNLLFGIKNLFRDFSDAIIYTKNGASNFVKNYGIAIKDYLNKGKWYKMYMANGGQSSSFYHKEQGRDISKPGFLKRISDINEMIESIPRIAEMIGSYERLTNQGVNHENAIREAMYDSGEVTVNFAKGGMTTKWLSRNVMPYFNAQIQGAVKMWNSFVHPSSFKEWTGTVTRATLMAIPAIILNEMIWGDDDDYEELSDDIKGGYYLFKIADKKFIRIPRGRVESVIGDAMQRAIRYTKGDENAYDGYIDAVKTNISPFESLGRFVWSPLTDVKDNITWYGGQIENSSMQNLPVSERYDNNTSSIAKVLSKIYPKLSPKKWHYLLDQYSGIIGDIVLPLTSKNNDAITVLSKASGFYVNSLNNNKYTNQFYDKKEELTQAKNSGNATGVDDAKMRYFNKMNTKISTLYKEKNSQSGEEADATQLLIVQLQRQTLDGLKSFSTTLDKYSYGLNDEDLYEDYYREATRECFGAETALIDYDKRVYEKATNFNKAGIDWDTFYNVYFDAQDITSDYDENGDVISGSRKQKITKYVKSLKLTATQKYMLMGLLGYKNANGESQVKSQLIRSGFKGEELKEMMDLCGYGK